MQPADLINGSFEAFGGLFILNHCRVLYSHKMIKGVSRVSTFFFTSWGMWNLYYYPTLGQWMSFYGGCMLVTTNLIYIVLMMYYSRYPGGIKGNDG